MDPLHWKREHQRAWAVMCAFGAVLGVLLAFIHSPFFSVTQPWQLSVFVEWLLLPQSYWPWPLLGFLMSGLIFYAVQLFKQVQAITGAGDPLAAAGRDRIARLSQRVRWSEATRANGIRYHITVADAVSRYHIL